MTDIKNNVNESMLDLFVLEVDTHSKKIIDLTNTLNQEDDISTAYKTLINAARAIKGAAKLVHIDIASRLIEHIESLFLSLQEKNITLNIDGTNTINNSISLLKTIANLSVEELNTPSDDILNNIENTQQQFELLLAVDSNQESEITPSSPDEKKDIDPIGDSPFVVADPIDSEMFNLFLIEFQNSLLVIGDN